MHQKTYKLIVFLLCLMASIANYANPSMPEITFKPIVNGIKEPMKTNVLTWLNIHQWTEAEKLTPTIIQTFYDLSSSRIKKALEPYGYFKPIIQSRLTHQGLKWEAEYTIRPGKRIRLTQVTINITGSGLSNKKLQTLLKKFSIKSGQYFDSQEYEKAKQSIFDTAETQGYIDGHFTKNSVVVDLERYTAKIILHFDTGERYFFGPVTFSKTPLDNAFLKRYIDFKEGDPYDSSKLITLQQAYSDTHYFQQVTVLPKKEKAKSFHVPTNIHLFTRKKQQYNFGLGFGTDTGARGTAGWEHRLINSYGHHLNVLYNISQKDNSLSSTYYIPGKNPITDLYTINASISNEDFKNVENHTKQVTASYIRRKERWQRTLSLSYQRERFKIDDDPTERTVFLLPSISWMRVIADNPIFATRGYRIDINIRGAAESLFSDITFMQTQMHAKKIFTLGKMNRLVVRGNLGITTGSGINKELPSTLRFYAGGAESVRGYSYKEIGPGNFTLVGSGEYQQHLRGKLYATIFADAGNASNDISFRTEKGVGFGIMYASPIGPLALTFAKAMTKNGNPHRIQFSMGPDL